MCIDLYGTDNPTSQLLATVRQTSHGVTNVTYSISTPVGRRVHSSPVWLQLYHILTLINQVNIRVIIHR